MPNVELTGFSNAIAFEKSELSDLSNFSDVCKIHIELLNSIAILHPKPGIVTSKFRQYFGFNHLSFAGLAFATLATGTVIVRLGSLK